MLSKLAQYSGKVFIGSHELYAAGGVIVNNKISLLKMPATIYGHPIIVTDELYLVGCHPRYLDRYFCPEYLYSKNVWLYTTIPNYDILLRRFDIQPKIHILETDYDNLDEEHKQKYIKLTTTTEVIMRVLL